MKVSIFNNEKIMVNEKLWLNLKSFNKTIINYFGSLVGSGWQFISLGSWV